MQPLQKAALAGAISLAVAFPAAAQDETAPVTAETVVATVNGTEITVGHMLVLRARLPQQYQTLPEQVLFDGILDQLVQQEILRGTSDGPSKVGRLIMDNEERALLATEAAQAIAAERVTEEAIQAAYDETFGAAEPETAYNASHILVETEEAAQALVEELAGGADFVELARERSTGPSGPNGGNLGWFGAGMMVAPFEEAVMALAPGEVSQPVETQFGWHVIILNEVRQAAVPALEEVRADLAQQLEQDALQEAIAQLQESANISRIETGEIDASVIGDMTLLED
jgi:peptidyl-prolyl cis-trans isomerase C